MWCGCWWPKGAGVLNCWCKFELVLFWEHFGWRVEFQGGCVSESFWEFFSCPGRWKSEFWGWERFGSSWEYGGGLKGRPFWCGCMLGSFSDRIGGLGRREREGRNKEGMEGRGWRREGGREGGRERGEKGGVWVCVWGGTGKMPPPATRSRNQEMWIDESCTHALHSVMTFERS